MFTITGISTHTQEIKRSRFLATVAPVGDEAEAKQFIAAHAVVDASHNCWAWRIGQAYRFNDDGEPSGTAGKPILQAIDGQDLDQVAVVVTRWFGGVLLGSGGLMRAYGGTAALCLQAAEKARLVQTAIVKLGIGFSDLALVKARLGALSDTELVSEDFTAVGAVLTFRLPEANVQVFRQVATDLTSGRAVIDRG